MISHVNRFFRLSLAISFCICWSFLIVSAPSQAQTTSSAVDSLLSEPKPPDAPAEWKNLLGIYGHTEHTVIVLERNQTLFLRDSKDAEFPMQSSRIPLAESPSHSSVILGGCFSISRNEYGAGTSLTTCADNPQPLTRSDAGADPTHFYRVTPTRPVEDVRAEAFKLAPPEEAGPFRKPDLVELAPLDPAIHLDIRYASGNNFLSTPVYTQARAFMQRPAAEALVRVLHKLQPLGYGLLIHDAYRPWYVTKIFWDATPPEGKIFVADPQKGSKHNRGCAVDLTLYELANGKAVEMPGLYDEMSPRSFPNFSGGTSLQRWHRDLLRRAMESEGFTVNEDEWWHFDYKDWKQYGILNVPFERLADSLPPTAVRHQP
jgi:D-alanyl-D-alanine dipeptidase